MLKTLYSVYDKKSGTYAAPFVEVNDGTAIRALQDLVTSNDSHPFAKHSEDFSLERLGSFNELSGEIGEDPVGEVIQLEQLVQKQE